jgi:hypothetical protein
MTTKRKLAVTEPALHAIYLDYVAEKSPAVEEVAHQLKQRVFGAVEN